MEKIAVSRRERERVREREIGRLVGRAAAAAAAATLPLQCAGAPAKMDECWAPGLTVLSQPQIRTQPASSLLGFPPNALTLSLYFTCTYNKGNHGEWGNAVLYWNKRCSS